MNGNLTYDAHKNITNIEYNYLNLPSKIPFTDNRSITFWYDATGKKLRKTVSGNGRTEERDYLDGIEYKDGKPDQFIHSEGSVRMDKDGQFKYYFVLRDHLGNTRVTFSDLNNDDQVNEKEEIIQINNYYAFGLNMEGNWNGKDGTISTTEKNGMMTLESYAQTQHMDTNVRMRYGTLKEVKRFMVIH